MAMEILQDRCVYPWSPAPEMSSEVVRCCGSSHDARTIMDDPVEMLRPPGHGELSLSADVGLAEGDLLLQTVTSEVEGRGSFPNPSLIREDDVDDSWYLQDGSGGWGSWVREVGLCRG
ncbi:hypothetical protein Dimus_016214 [Dionaea muscipula]